MPQEDIDSNYRRRIADGLAEFFKDEPHKIALWLLVPNPHFGGCSPTELIVMRRTVGLAKVVKFIECALDENVPLVKTTKRKKNGKS
jgi:hypothetical protein